ncbi:MAG: protein translocase subunit SecD [Dehalococcoidia bacterium]|nr:MAG: protein translocase subunit SecD [Dehalococcoidia bacterium]
MNVRNLLVLLTIVIIFILSLLTILPIDKGVLFGRGILLGLDLQGGIRLVYQADLSGVETGREDEIIDGVVAVIANRINPLGVTEPVISKQGDDRIIVELPGIDISDVQKERIGRTALLEFRELVIEDGEEKWIPATGTVDGEDKVLNSSYFKENTIVNRDNFGNIYLVFEWDEEGSQLSEQITTRLLGQPLGIFEGDEPLIGEDGYPIAPTIRAVITDSGQIEGLSQNDATELSKQLNAGRLPVPLEVIYEENVSPALGADFIELSAKAGIIGIVLILLFMVLYYRIPGFVASLALIFYGVVVLAIFKLVSVTLTLAGIGGFVLSIGMAVDANVLIFERMKEELQAGRTLGAAVKAGFDRAWTAIRDSNITTFIVCIILIWVGSQIVAGAPVQGFGLTLLIGVAVSMFTAIIVTRTLLRLFVGSKIAKKTGFFSPYLGKNDV